jgi:hypothetical protein
VHVHERQERFSGVIAGKADRRPLVALVVDELPAKAAVGVARTATISFLQKPGFFQNEVGDVGKGGEVFVGMPSTLIMSSELVVSRVMRVEAHGASSCGSSPVCDRSAPRGRY